MSLVICGTSRIMILIGKFGLDCSYNVVEMHDSLFLFRYSMALLDGFLGESEEGCQPSLAECVSRARDACKMPYIVGCAPVCYGVPVYRLRN